MVPSKKVLKTDDIDLNAGIESVIEKSAPKINLNEGLNEKKKSSSSSSGSIGEPSSDLEATDLNAGLPQGTAADAGAEGDQGTLAERLGKRINEEVDKGNIKPFSDANPAPAANFPSRKDNSRTKTQPAKKSAAFGVTEFNSENTVSTPDGASFVIDPDKIPAPFRTDNYFKELQNRINTRTTLPTDIQAISIGTEKSPVAVMAYLKGDNTTGQAYDRTDFLDKNKKELSAAITNYSLAAQKNINVEEVLADPDKASALLHDIQTFYSSRAQSTFDRRQQIGTADVPRAELDQMLNANDAQFTKYSNILSDYQKLSEPLLRQQITDKTVEDDLKAGVPQEQTLNKIAQRLDPRNYALAQVAAIAPAFRNPNNPAAQAGALWDMVAGSKDKDELLNSVKGAAAIEMNNSFQKLAADKAAIAHLTGDESALNDAKVLYKRYDPNIIEKYPALLKQQMAAEVSQIVAERSGNLKGSEMDGLKGASLKTFGASLADYEAIMREKGWFDDPARKELAYNLLSHPSLFSDASYFGSAGKEFIKPFKDLGLSVADISGFRNMKDIYSDKLKDQLFPEETPGITGFTKGFRTVVNTTSNLAGMTAIAAITGGVGRAVGIGLDAAEVATLSAEGLTTETGVNLAAKAATAQSRLELMGNAMSFGLPSIDANLKESYDFIDNDAARGTYVAMGAILNTYGGKLLDLPKVSAVPGLKEIFGKAANELTEKTITQDAAKELLASGKKSYVDYVTKFAKAGGTYAKNTLEGAATMAYFTASSSILKSAFGDPHTNMSDIMNQTGHAFLDGALGMLVFGAIKTRGDLNVNKNSSFKNTLYQMALTPDAAHDIFTMNKVSDADYNQKLSILNTAVMHKKILDATMTDQNTLLDPNQQAVYVSNKTVESFVRDAAAKETDEKVKQELLTKADKLAEQSRQTLDGLKFSETLEPLEDLYAAEKERDRAMQDYTANPTEENDKAFTEKSQVFSDLTDKYFSNIKNKSDEEQSSQQGNEQRPEPQDNNPAKQGSSGSEEDAGAGNESGKVEEVKPEEEGVASAAPDFTGLSHVQSAGELLKSGAIDDAQHTEIVKDLTGEDADKKSAAADVVKAAKAKQIKIAEAIDALPEVRNKIYRDALKGNMDAGLKEAAGQLNNKESNVAENIYGPTISRIARELYPDEQAPDVSRSMDKLKEQEKPEDVVDADAILPKKKERVAEKGGNSPAPAAEKQEKAPAERVNTPKNKSAEIEYVPVADINTDVERFQPRGTDFSKESVDKIIDSFDDNKLDPVVLYKDGNKDYVLAGHSRLEAHKQLSDLPPSDPRRKAAIENGFEPNAVKARYFKGTEAEAREFADRSNDLGTKNKDYESAASLRKMREGGASKTATMQRAQTDFGKDGRYINMLSYINPKGKLMDALKGFDQNEDAGVKNEFRQMAQWIGSVREKAGEAITNAHEDEMMDYLMDNVKSKKISKEAEFVSFINNKIGTLDYDSEKPLNLNRVKADNPAQMRYDTELDGLTQEIRERQKEYDTINERLNNPSHSDYINPSDADYADVTKAADARKNKLSEELVGLRRELSDLRLDKGKILAEGTGQMGLFESANISRAQEERINEELADDGITFNDIKDYEANITDPSEVRQQGDGVTEEAAAIPEDVQQSKDEQDGRTEQDQGGAAIQGQQRAGAPLEVDKIEEKRQALVAQKDAFRAALKASRGNLGVNFIDPKLLEEGVKLVGAYIDLGVTRFADIVNDLAGEFAEKSEDFVNAMKAAYGGYKSLHDVDGMDSSKTVREFKPEDITALPNENVPAAAEETTSTAVENPDSDYKPAGDFPEREWLDINMREAVSPEDKDYWTEQSKTFETEPLKYWQDVYQSYASNAEDGPDRMKEAVDGIKEELDKNNMVTYKGAAAGPLYRVTEFDAKDGVELTGENGKINMSMADFTENMQQVKPAEMDLPIFEGKPPVHPIIQSLLDSISREDLSREDAEREIDNQIVMGLSGDSNKRIRQEIYSSLTDKKQTIANSGVNNILNEVKKLYNATGTTTDLESDRTRAVLADRVGKEDVSDEGTTDRPSDIRAGDEIISTGVPIKDSPGVLPFDATTEGAKSDSGLSEYEQPERSGTSAAGAADNRGGSESDEGRVSSDFEGAGDAKQFIEDGSDRSFEDKLEDQKKAESVPVIPLDRKNIAETLPLLKPGQQEDVYKAEDRFISHQDNESLMYGKGMLFTNGTGTGKTLLGSGIASRMAKQGKDQVTIIVPTDKKAKDWIEEAKWLGLDIKQLENTKDAPEGMVVTTYANMQANTALQNRLNHLVIYDESHKLNSNQAGDYTANQEGHNQLSVAPSVARKRAEAAMNYDKRLSRLRDTEGSYEKIKLLNLERDKKAKEIFDQTKVLFLSATPFSYHGSLTYGDGYLYSISQTLRADDNAQGKRDNFYISNLGYRMRYNKLTRPEAGVDVDLLERQFTEGLKKKGIISSRKLDIPYDYSREFKLIDDQIGNKIDEGLKIAGDYNKYKHLPTVVNNRFNFIYKNQLMEALKAKWAVDQIKDHLELGRKVIVSHTYIDNQPAHPFEFNSPALWSGIDGKDMDNLRNEIRDFEFAYPEYKNMDMSGLKSPIQTLTEKYGDKIVLFNGRESKVNREKAVKEFNRDGSGKDIFLMQTDAGKEGISLHDKTGKHQRALINLALPYKPTDAIQLEGRPYRTGQKSDVPFEYPILNTAFERGAYASKINERVRTAENFAMGEEARNMEIAFKEGYLNANDARPSLEQGKGGKAEDSRMDKTTEFDKAKTYYYKRGKRTAAQKRNVEGDYYGTPEPMGYKMVDWLDWKPNEKLMEPNAGHGAIARFMSRATNNVFIEPNIALRTEVGLTSEGDTRGGVFEDLHPINKFDGIAMNPPFGVAGKTAMEHLLKATVHLRDGGRINAIVPTGKMDDRIQQWQEGEESKDFHVRAKVLLPTVLFDRAGTNVSTQLLIIDKVEDPEKAAALPPARNLDMRHYDNVNEFFDAIEDLDMPSRIDAGKFANEALPSSGAVAPTEGEFKIPEGDNAVDLLQVVEGTHTKTGADIFTAKMNSRLTSEEFSTLSQEARKFGGYYSRYKSDGAEPGFIFKDRLSAEKFSALANGKGMPETKDLSLADRIRTLKLGQDGVKLYSTVLPIIPIWNGAVEAAAKIIEAGGALADALRKGYDHIKMNYDKEWEKDKYTENMLGALKDRGLMEYDLTDIQKNEADKIVNRLKRGANPISEMNKVTAVFEIAKQKLTDPADIKDLEDSHRELQRYVWDALGVHEIEKTTNAVNLDLGKQTFWQKRVVEDHFNTMERAGRVQESMEKQGVKIDERNNFMNYQDRWRAIAEAKINKVLKEVGLSTVDMFVTKGGKKVEGSLFDRMSDKKTGVPDFYRKFGLFLYAQHAPERNAHNAELRTNNLHAEIIKMEGDLADLKAQNQLMPSPAMQGLITKKENDISLYNEYRDKYRDPNANKNYVKVLENKIPSKFRLMDDGGSGMTNAQAAEIIKAATDDGHLAMMQGFENEVREKIITPILDQQLEYGLIAPEDYHQLQSYYSSYVPLKVEDKYFENSSTFTDHKTPGAKIYKSKGANYIDFENRVNPLTQSVLDLQAAIYEGEQNKYRQTIAAAINDAPDQKVWQMKAAEFVPIKAKNGKIIRTDEINVPGDEGIAYKEDGQKKYLIINDVPLRKELTGNNVLGAIPVLANINKFLRAVNTTLNPNFLVTNPFRDIETAGIVLGATQKAEVLKNFAQNTRKTLSIMRGSYREQSGKETGYWTNRAREYTNLGGNMSWFHQDTADEMIRDVEKAADRYNKSGIFEHGKQLAVSAADLINRMNQAAESSTRVSIFDALVRSGTEPYKAAEVARNATINFTKKGNYGAVTNSLYLFANAAMQGSANVFRTLLTTKKGLAFAGGLVALGATQSFVNQAFSDCDGDPADCYDNIPEYQKDRFMIIKKPFGKGFITIPLAYGFNVFYGVGEKAAQTMQGKETWQKMATGTMSSMLNAFNPVGNDDTPALQQISPTATDPIVQWYTNKDAFGRPIYDDNQFTSKNPDAERGFARNSATAKDMSQWLSKQTGGNERIKGKIDVSPGTLDWIWQTATGGMGTFMKQAANTALPDEGKYSEIDPKDIPIVNRFYTTPKELADKSEIFDIKDRSYNEVLSPDDVQKFNDATDKAVRLDQLAPEKAETYKKAVSKNQFELNNLPLIDRIDRSKTELLEPDEIQDIMTELNNMAADDLIPPSYLKSYKAEISENQNNIRKKNNKENE